MCAWLVNVPLRSVMWCLLSTVLQVMPPQRLPESPTVKEKGWSPSSPSFLLLLLLSPPSPLQWSRPTPISDPITPFIQPHLSLIPSPQQLHQYTGCLVLLQPHQQSFFRTFSSSQRFITHWLHAKLHGYRRSCPRERCVDQPTTGEFYLLEAFSRMYFFVVN